MPAAPRSSSARGLPDREAAGLAPVAEPRPRAQVLAQFEEAFFDLGADGPVAVPAIAELVYGRRVAAADAVADHAQKTGGTVRGLRLCL